MISEDKTYKHKDYMHRRRDPYAAMKYQLIMKWLPEKNNLRVLNAGCGSGEMNGMLTKNKTWQVDAIDTDVEAIKMSQEIPVPNLNVIQTSIEDHNPGVKYDIIICNDVLEHIENDIAAIVKLSDLLKPGGIVCISVPALDSLFGYHDEMLGHYRRYSKKELKKKLSPFFEIKKCRYFAFSLIPAAVIYSRLLRKPYPMGTGSGLLSVILKAESVIGVPLGISLLAMAVKK